MATYHHRVCHSCDRQVRVQLGQDFPQDHVLGCPEQADFPGRNEAIKANVPKKRELLQLLDGLAVDEPFERSYEGLDDGCHFCDGEEHFTQPGYVAIHEDDCPWVLARDLLGKPRTNHFTRSTAPELPKPKPAGGRWSGVSFSDRDSHCLMGVLSSLFAEPDNAVIRTSK